MIDSKPMEIRNNQMPGSLELAYLGDTIYDLYVRTRLVQRGGKMKQLHRQAVDVVCNHGQSEALRFHHNMHGDTCSKGVADE